MKNKATIVAILGIAGMGIFAAPDLAQADRICRVDGRTGRLICQDDYDRNRPDRNRRDRSIDRFEERNRRYNNRYGQIEARVDRLYREVLGRRADRGGLRNYTQRVIDGWNYNRVRLELARSREAREKINRIYREELGRNADRNGVSTYQRHLANGWSLNEVRDHIRRNYRDRNRRRRYRR